MARELITQATKRPVNIMRILLLLFFSATVFAHPHHHSIAVAEYNQQSKQIELSLKILIEDFEKINKDKKAHLYLQNHLVIEANSTILTAVFQGREEEHEFMWFYYTFDVELSPANNSINVTNRILKNINKNQFNTVKITLFKKTQAHNFLLDEEQYTFIFE